MPCDLPVSLSRFKAVVNCSVTALILERRDYIAIVILE